MLSTNKRFVITLLFVLLKKGELWKEVYYILKKRMQVIIFLNVELAFNLVQIESICRPQVKFHLKY